jgi:hypothetical protein
VSPLALWVTCAVLSAASAYGVLRLAPRLRPVKPECPKLAEPEGLDAVEHPLA